MLSCSRSRPAIPFTRRPLALSLLAALASGAAAPAVVHAQAAPVPATAATAASAPVLPLITVTATRTERATDDVPATVTVYTADKIQRADARDLKDLLAEEVDVSVRQNASRFTAAGSSTGRAGNEGVNVRGLEGNQVLMVVDGIRVPNAFAFGPFATGRADFFDVDALSSAEVLRGPSSTQFGSDGLAGAVSLTTLRPQDLLKSGQSFAGFARLGYNSIDHSANSSVALAGGGDRLTGLLMVTHRRGEETDNQGRDSSPNSNRTTPNPLDYDSTNVLGKLNYRFSPAHELGLTLEARERQQTTDVLSANAVVPALPSQTNPTANQTLSLHADDKITRNRVSLEHRYDDTKAAFLTQLKTQFYWQDSKVTQFSAEDRAFSADRTRDNRYQERVVGLSTLGQARLDGTLKQRLSFGLDASQTDVSGLRDGTVAPFGETFPAKPFPDTRYRLVGAFAQTEIETGPFSVIPALRFDHYSLDPSSAGYSGEAVSLRDQAVTPRLGVIWRVTPNLAPYAQASLGFRAPTPDQVNNGFENAASYYRSEGNPNLKPEHATSFELGARGQVGPVRWQIAAFNNRYKDFISQEQIAGDFTENNKAVFQFINLAEARIRGGEARMEWSPAPGWTGQFAISHTRGDRTVDGVTEPLDSISPLRLRMGVRYETERYSLGGQWQHADGKQASRISDPTYFATPAYDVFDLTASYQVTKSLRLQAAVLNLLDETYWRWNDVRGLSSASTTLAAYTAPGRSAQVSLRADF
ncbi:MAG TPA: TonB-dependent hemoglobin/transferrin/lactoferrin family receptor [Ideonella sp.]|nr:TonB-dependent hemoglobin/transferrin/lactoferrin family receptor [Ideonella sp.]